jgi:hypothetical protein
MVLLDNFKIKMIIRLFIIIVIIQSIASAQNLVLNHSFEEYWPHKNYPPIFYGDTFYAKNWYNVYQGIPSKVNHFFESTPDGPIKNGNNVPFNDLGYHPAHSGKAYVGLGLIALDGQMCHLTGTLKDELNKDNTYEVSFYIKFAGEKCAVYYTKFEISFSGEKDSTSFQMKKELSTYYARYQNLFKDKTKADIIFDNIPLLNDTSPWLKLSQKYIARGNEKYMTIGLFYQGEELSKYIDEMAENYTKIYLNNKKRQRFIKNIDKQKIPFIKYNPGFNFKKLIQEHPFIVDGCYYLIDDVSVVILNNDQ